MIRYGPMKYSTGLIFLITLGTSGFCLVPGEEKNSPITKSSEGTCNLTDLSDKGVEIEQAFNAEKGNVRLILFVSPG